MIFAFYGSVPGIGARGLTELTALDRVRMAVVLDFRLDRRSFRVSRIARRRGTT